MYDRNDKKKNIYSWIKTLGKITKSISLGYYITLQQISTKACGAILCDCNEVSKILNIMTVNFIFVLIIRHAQ
jgi:hypothetical protein